MSAPGMVGPRRARGFSLVELMVAMTLSLVLLGGALSILYSSRVTYTENERIAKLQEAGRTVVELILRDARAAGFQGCQRPSGSTFVNGLNDGNTLLWRMQQPMFGFDGGAGAFTPALPADVPDATANSDIIVLRTTREGMPTFRLNTAVSNPTANLDVTGPPNVTLPAASTMLISDCRGASAFAGTLVPVTPTTYTITHAAGGVPGNVTTSLTRTFELNATVMTLDTVVYYVRPLVAGGPPYLWRIIGGAAPQALIEGVENLQLQYGVDTDGDLLVNQYLTAAQVEAANRWANVVSLTLAVLVRSNDEANLERDTRTYTLLDQVRGPFNDRRQRSVFTTTVTLRNRTT